MNLACEDANSKVEVVTVADVDDVDRVGNKLRFGHKAKLLFRL